MASSAPVPSTLQSLVLVARQRGVELSVERLRHDHSLGDGDIDEATFARMSAANGLKAKAANFQWQDFAKLGDAFPVIARLRDGVHVIVTAYHPGKDGEEETVSVINPMSAQPQAEAVPKSLFMDNWSGRLLLLRSLPPAKSEPSSRTERGRTRHCDGCGLEGRREDPRRELAG